MRIVDRVEFLHLPSGTVYSFYEPTGNMEDLHIKHDTLPHGNDWRYQSLLQSVEAKDSGEWADIILDAETNGTVFRNDLNCIERDGMYESNQRFVIYDKDDVRKLIEALAETLKEVQ